MAERAVKGPAEKGQEQRFMAINRDRLRRVFETLHPRQQAFVELVPLLFHVNPPLLPGYVSQDTPAGLSDYTPSRGATSAAKQLVRTFVYEHRMQRSFAIRGLYLMGSPGTIAYTRHSDLDLWLVHDPELAPAEVDKLREKARRIEEWSQGTGLEIHFFVFDAERFKRGETLSLSDESSGSSQHYLLLDEFYRSGLLLAGLRPLWWAVPPEEEHRYDEFVEDALHKRILSARSYVDFGGLARIPAGEFFGGTIWQIYKSIESPYKSVMKLLLMEAYASEYPKIGLLSHRHKLALLKDGVTLDDIDPYIAMYRKLEEYLASQADKGRSEERRVGKECRSRWSPFEGVASGVGIATSCASSISARAGASTRPSRSAASCSSCCARVIRCCPSSDAAMRTTSGSPRRTSPSSAARSTRPSTRSRTRSSSSPAASAVRRRKPPCRCISSTTSAVA